MTCWDYITKVTTFDPKGVDNIFSSLKLFSSLHITPPFPQTFSSSQGEMSSRNARGSRESVDSRLDGYDNGRNEDEENSRSHIPFDNRVRFFPDRRDILGDDGFRSRSPLRRPRYEDLQHHGNFQYRPNNFGPGFDYDIDNDPRFYPNHGESVSEFVPYPPRYYPEDNEYYEEEEYDRSRSWQS